MFLFFDCKKTNFFRFNNTFRFLERSIQDILVFFDKNLMIF